MNKSVKLVKKIDFKQYLNEETDLYDAIYDLYQKNMSFLNNRAALDKYINSWVIDIVPKLHLRKSDMLTDYFKVSGNIHTGLVFNLIPNKRYTAYDLHDLFISCLPPVKHLLQGMDADTLSLALIFKDQISANEFYTDIAVYLYNECVNHITQQREKILQSLKANLLNKEEVNKARNAFDEHISELKNSLISMKKQYLN